jgi:hypothetical protein
MDMMNHLSLLSLDLNVTAVLAIVQDFEINSRTIMGRPVSPAQWEASIHIYMHVLLSIRS